MNLYLVNGFLGSGKTTAIVNACKQLINKKISVAVITNDQGSQQVDSAYLQSLQLPNGEVANGCFCCRYHEFEKIVSTLKTSVQPEIIFAESVGSCTDLVATVAKPFALHHHEVKIVISVFADAYLMHSIMKGTSCFIEEAVQYIYKKQLEEADIIVINKTDMLSKNELVFVKEIITTSYPHKKIIYQDSYNDNDIENWIWFLNDFVVPPQRHSPELDYEKYGAGEGMLAWFDQKLLIHTHNKSVAPEVGLMLARIIHKNLQRAGYTIGHLKFLLSSEKWNKKISFTTSGMIHDLQITELPECKHCDVLVNARVQTTPSLLQQIIENSIEEIIMHTGCHITTHQSASFKSGFPTPVFRLT